MRAPSDAPVMIMAGGTGGHVFPGLAVAAVLRERGVPVVWLGGETGIENRVVPAAGLELERIQVSGLRGKGLASWLLAPLKISYAVVQAARILRRWRPRAVLAFGGFAAGPGGLAAWLRRDRLIVHEQNSIPGLTNRVLARLARVRLAGFPNALPKAVHVGNPVRDEITQLKPKTIESGRRRLLILGGSQGARAINDVLPAALAEMRASDRPEVRHQTGEADAESVRARYANAGVDAHVEPFIEDMSSAYAWADLVVSRAGALTLAELALAGLAAVLIPLPIAADDHQTANARYHSDAQATVLLPQSDLDASSLAEILTTLLTDPRRLTEMGAANHRLATPNAARAVADACLAVAA